MRIQFRASDFSLIEFSSLACANRNRLLVRNRIGDGVLFIFFCVCSRDPAVLTQDFKPTPTIVVACRREETRRVHIAWPRTQASEPVLTESSLAVKRRAECASRGLFFESSIRARLLLCCCVYSLVRSHERRAMSALLFVVSRSEPASTDICGLSAERRIVCVSRS